MRGMRWLVLLIGVLAGAGVAAQEVVRSERAAFRVGVFAQGLEHPWGGAFLPDGALLVTERPGRMRLVSAQGAVSPPLAGVPQVVTGGQAGLLDVALAPDFARTREIFFCASTAVEGGALTRLWRAVLGPEGLQQVRPVLDVTPPQASGRLHFGCRILFGRDGSLFLSAGERNQRERAQRLDDLAGKVLRLTRDGMVPADNPFAGRAGARAEIFTWGHRNPQGLALNPWTGSVWEAEFGPRGGDEVNILRAGANYGWPRVSYGREYSGGRISESPTAPGITDPVHVWVPSVSPSGIAFYDGTAFPGWRRSLFVATLAPPMLVRLTTEGDRVVGEERLLEGMARLRDVIAGPDGLLYILTDEERGRILRLEPG